MCLVILSLFEVFDSMLGYHPLMNLDCNAGLIFYSLTFLLSIVSFYGSLASFRMSVI